MDRDGFFAIHPVLRARAARLVVRRLGGRLDSAQTAAIVAVALNKLPNVIVVTREGARSLNLASTAAVAVYEAWRQFDYGRRQTS